MPLADSKINRLFHGRMSFVHVFSQQGRWFQTEGGFARYREFLKKSEQVKTIFHYGKKVKNRKKGRKTVKSGKLLYLNHLFF